MSAPQARCWLWSQTKPRGHSSPAKPPHCVGSGAPASAGEEPLSGVLSDASGRVLPASAKTPVSAFAPASATGCPPASGDVAASGVGALPLSSVGVIGSEAQASARAKQEASARRAMGSPGTQTARAVNRRLLAQFAQSVAALPLVGRAARDRAPAVAPALKEARAVDGRLAGAGARVLGSALAGRHHTATP